MAASVPEIMDGSTQAFVDSQQNVVLHTMGWECG
jgi:hypothetical protein